MRKSRDRGRAPSSGVKYLMRRQRPGVPLSRTPWSGRYLGREVILGRWGDGMPNPLDRHAAMIVLQRFIAAVDNGTFNPDGEVQGGPPMLIRQMPKHGRALLIFIRALKTMAPADRRATVDWLSALVEDMNRQAPVPVQVVQATVQ